MLDIKFIRENKDIVQEGARKKRINFSVDELLKTDDRRRELMTSIEKKRAEQNQWSDKIVRTPEAMAKAQLIAEMKMLKDELQKEEEEQKEVMKKWQALIVQVRIFRICPCRKARATLTIKRSNHGEKFLSLVLRRKAISKLWRSWE